MQINTFIFDPDFTIRLITQSYHNLRILLIEEDIFLRLKPMNDFILRRCTVKQYYQIPKSISSVIVRIETDRSAGIRNI